MGPAKPYRCDRLCEFNGRFRHPAFKGLLHADPQALYPAGSLSTRLVGVDSVM